MGGVFTALFGGDRRGPAGAERMTSTRSRGLSGHGGGNGDHRRRAMLSKKYSYIPDTYTSLDQVVDRLYSHRGIILQFTIENLHSSFIILGLVDSQVAAALRDQGLESSNLILGVDFTKSNEWTGE
jgi:E3 ubiquitin-protein ligase RGLG